MDDSDKEVIDAMYSDVPLEDSRSMRETLYKVATQIFKKHVRHGASESILDDFDEDQFLGQTYDIEVLYEIIGKAMVNDFMIDAITVALDTEYVED